MIGQMTIFDWMPDALDEYPNINDIPEAEAVRIVGENLGVAFTWNDFFEEWMAKKGKFKMGLKYDHFTLHDNQDLFLGTDYSIGTSGGAAPCSGIRDAVDWFKRKMKEYRVK